jgi:hexokinase
MILSLSFHLLKMKIHLWV